MAVKNLPAVASVRKSRAMRYHRPVAADLQRLGPSLHREVRRAGGTLHPDDAARNLLRPRGAVGEAARSVVLALARSDPRLEIDGEGLLVLSALPRADLPLESTEFVVVDVETTGTSPGAARITEIGAVRLSRGRRVAHFERLVDPGTPVPRGITRLTGIHAGMLDGAPPFARIAVEWLGFLGNAVLVAHNAPFDRGFLDRELRRCGEEPPDNPVMCTVRLARRLIPELRSHCLDSLAGHLGIPFRQRHRALGDAEVTAEILAILLQRAAARGVQTLGQLQKVIEGPQPRME
jgi:DNA polymerase III epsilon subunit family exonuclease